MGYDEAAAGYDRAHGGGRSQKRFARIEAPILAATRGAGAVLEVGVGTGRLLSQVAAPLRVGIDPSAGMLERASEKPGLSLVRADAHHLPFADASFDAVIAGKGVFRYLSAAAAFAECARVLKAGGRLAIHQYSAMTWSLKQLFGREASSPEVRAMHVESPSALEAGARAAGFSSVRSHLFRSIRFYPYALEIPRLIAGRWWSHIVLVARRSNN